jgi:serum/glucocorticoid-regulated kinase 2
MIIGLPPFYDENVQEMYQRILYMNLVFPPGEMSPEVALALFFSLFLVEAKGYAKCPDPQCQDFVTKMLERDPRKRLGRNGVHEIKEHPFFRSINWADLGEGKVSPTWKPPVGKDDDTANFDESFTSLAAVDSVSTPGAVGASVQRQFANFTYYNGSLSKVDCI